MISNRNSKKVNNFRELRQNTLKTFKKTGGIQRHAGTGRLKNTTECESSLICCQVRANPRLALT